MNPPSFSCGSAILAAGQSRRMGQSKPLLTWGTATILSHLTDLHRDCVDQVAVVCRADDIALIRELDLRRNAGIGRILNHESGSEMFQSVRLALAWPGWRPATTHILLALADQPQITPDTIKRVIEAARRSPDRIIQPTYLGRRRHPVVLPRQLARTIASDLSFRTLRDALILHSAAITTLQIDDPGLSRDLDTPVDYAAARKRFRPDQT